MGEYVQKLDYVYNLQGWLKAINHPLSGKDPGEDYYSNGLYARDVFGEILNYYAGDYKRTGSGLLAADAITPATNTHVKDKGKDLFNGNISSTVTYTGFDQAGGSADPLMAQGYRYDYLNRLVSTFTETALPTAFSGWSASSVTTLDNIYQENLSYDANGNIKTLERTAFNRTVNSVQTTAMDMMTYHYDQSLSNSLSQTKKAHNKLLYIDDAAADDLNIEDFTDQAEGNYAYDAKGRLIRDLANEIDSIAWTAYDKVREVIRTDGSGKPRLSYTYDGFGRRLSKTVTRPGQEPETYYYVYDGGGNQMALYHQDLDESEEARYRLVEHALYGASREGVYKNGARIGSESVATTLEKSAMLFEVSDHLGNVRAVVSGQKVTVADIPSYQYHFGFESAQDAPDQYWDSWVFSKDEKYSGEQSVYVTGFGHSAYVPVEPGDTISAEAMMKFVSGTQGGFIYMALQDENGQNEIGRRSDQVDAGAHQNINTWSRIYQSDLVVPAGKYRLYFYLRVSTSAGNSPSWFDDFKVTVRGKNARAVEVADIITLTDYYPFGMAMPGRTLSNSEHYRYGFNGMEKDDDWYGAGNEYTTEFRQLDVRVGRWMSMDPMMAKFPGLSPYNFAENNPIIHTDPLGLAPEAGGLKGFWLNVRLFLDKFNPFDKTPGRIGYKNKSGVKMTHWNPKKGKDAVKMRKSWAVGKSHLDLKKGFAGLTNTLETIQHVAGKFSTGTYSTLTVTWNVYERKAQWRFNPGFWKEIDLFQPGETARMGVLKLWIDPFEINSKGISQLAFDEARAQTISGSGRSSIEVPRNDGGTSGTYYLNFDLNVPNSHSSYSGYSTGQNRHNSSPVSFVRNFPYNSLLGLFGLNDHAIQLYKSNRNSGRTEYQWILIDSFSIEFIVQDPNNEGPKAKEINEYKNSTN